MNLQAIVSHPRVRAARSVIQARDRQTLDEQIRIAAIPAPTGDEAERGRYLRDRFERLGMRAVDTDAVGNVIGILTGGEIGDASSGCVLVTAHLDTIFPRGTEVMPRTEGARIFAPGITDNARGLAALLAVADALSQTEVATRRPLAFVATVGEEGVGDLRGVKHLFRDGSPYRGAAGFLSIDGAGATRIVNQAIGSCRLRATATGLGGHSWGDRGLANPAHALGRAVGDLSGLRPPFPVDFSINVGRLGGGTSVNSIPAEAWLELDLRSDDSPTLEWLEAEARSILERGVRAEAEKSLRSGPLVLDIQCIGRRPCGVTPPKSPIVRAAVAVTRLLGGVPELAASSTDANVPISLGIPAVALGAGGRGGGVHTADEWFENHAGARGIERALLIVVAIAGVQGVDQDG